MTTPSPASHPRRPAPAGPEAKESHAQRSTSPHHVRSGAYSSVCWPPCCAVPLLLLTSSTPAAAFVVPPVARPAGQHVTADALPTVQINGVVWDQRDPRQHGVRGRRVHAGSSGREPRRRQRDAAGQHARLQPDDRAADHQLRRQHQQSRSARSRRRPTARGSTSAACSPRVNGVSRLPHRRPQPDHRRGHHRLQRRYRLHRQRPGRHRHHRLRRRQVRPRRRHRCRRRSQPGRLRRARRRVLPWAPTANDRVDDDRR